MNTVAARRPDSVRALFWAFSRLALQGFGGVLAVVQRELVEKRQWLTLEEFVEDWAVAQIMPGANVVNLSLIVGDRFFGWRGALAALSGMLALPMVVVLALNVGLSGIADQGVVQDALRGMGAVSAGLIAGTGLKLMRALRANAMGKSVCTLLAVLTFMAIGLLRLPLIWVLLGLGLPAMGWAYFRLLAQYTNTRA
ncbi:MAG: chromate transporter [Rhodoferax sp.]|nr:chromate transporter [Rhodoferax sp.]